MPLTRSETMARIRGRDPTPERILRSQLWRRGLRYRLHLRTAGGRPDIVFKGVRVAVFIDGCFWHGCPTHYVRPRTRAEFWANKLRTNVLRDRRQTLQLEGEGWRVLRYWEHEVRNNPELIATRIERHVKGNPRRQADQWRVLSVRPVGGHGSTETRHLARLREPSVYRIVRAKRGSPCEA